MNNAVRAMNRRQSSTRPIARVAFQLVGPFVIQFTVFITHFCSAQPGTWQSHFSYQSARSVAVVGNKVYCATQNGFFYYDKTTNEIVTLDKRQGPSGREPSSRGLSDVGINRLLYLADQKRLLIAYQNGNLDLMTVSDTGEPGEVKNSNTILTAPNVTGSRAINYIDRIGNNAYLSTDFGLVVFDVIRDEIRDTYFSPKPTNRVGAAVLATAVSNDTLFALSASPNVPATGLLLQAVRLTPNVNIADPANWQLVAGPGPGLQSVISNQGRLTASVGGQGVYERQNGKWVLIQPVSGQSVSLFSTPGGYGLAVDQTIVLPNSVRFSGSLLTASPSEIIADGDRVWVADRQNGLLEGRLRAFERIAPEGPVLDRYTSLSTYSQTLVATTQGGGGTPQVEIYSVPNRRWQSIIIPGNQIANFASAAYLPAEQRLYLGGGGALWSKTDGQIPTPVALSNSIDVGLAINSLAADRDGNLWIGTGSDTGRGILYVRRADGTVQAFPEANQFSISQVLPDDNGFIWFASTGNQLVVFDPTAKRRRSFNVDPLALVKDRNGIIWIGTDRGILAFDSPADAFDPRITVASLNQNQPRLLRNERIIAIAVDGGNQKWVGTSSGLYHLSADVSQLLNTFTAENSPLPGNTVQKLTIEPVSGRVFVLNGSKGDASKLVSYGGAATEPAETLSKLTIFPNPVRPDFAGTVGINGLTDNSTVKILDAGGQLVYETRSQGGTATWNLRDYRGRSAQTGIYLIVVVTADGTEGLAGKLAVVR